MAVTKPVGEKAQAGGSPLLSVVSKIASVLKDSPGAKNLSKQILQRTSTTFGFGNFAKKTVNWESWRKSQRDGAGKVVELSHADIFIQLGKLDSPTAENVRRALVGYLVANIAKSLSLATVYTLAIVDASGLDICEFAKELSVEGGATITPEYVAALRVVATSVAASYGYESLANIFAVNAKKNANMSDIELSEL
jgi:hypothetical protein